MNVHFRILVSKDEYATSSDQNVLRISLESILNPIHDNKIVQSILSISHALKMLFSGIIGQIRTNNAVAVIPH